MTPSEMVPLVFAHAKANYSKGWDLIVECYNSKELEEWIQKTGKTTLEEVIACMHPVIRRIQNRDLDMMLEANSHYVAAGEPPFWNVTQED